MKNPRLSSSINLKSDRLLDTLADDGLRINLIQQPGMEKYQHQLFLMPERRRFRVARWELEAFFSAFQSGSRLSQWEEQPAMRNDLVLCCTHGTKDKCCAKYGYKTFKALASTVAEHPLPFEVWESSHLGGCRLAASVIVLPNVRKYGRITPEQALPFLQAEARQQRFLPGYRGGSQLTPAQQSAEIAALTHLSTDTEQPTLALISDQGDDQAREIRFQWRLDQQQGELTVHCQATTLWRVDTCADLAQGPTESTVWQAKVNG